MNHVKVFIASPGDVHEERQLFSLVLDEARLSLAEHLNINLEAIKWETHAWPDAGKDGQDVINRQIGDYDVFVGIMWKRFGTPTKRADSGTEEEFERAFDLFKKYGRPKVMFYFKNTPFYSRNTKELDQFKKVLKFRERVTKLGVLFSEYDEKIEFERKFRGHLTRQLLEFKRVNQGLRSENPSKTTNAPSVFISYKSQDFNRVEVIYEDLKRSGIDVWMDAKDILPGKNWRKEINNALSKADIQLVCITFNLVDENSYSLTDFSVDSEINDTECYVMPVRLDNVVPPSYLADYQWTDLFDLKDTDKLIDNIFKVWEKLKNQTNQD